MHQPISIAPNPDSLTSQAYRDWLGVAASVLCAIHCAAMPFVVGFLPLLGLSFLAEPSFHKWMVGVCLALALLAFVPGWRRHHRLAPTLIGLSGLGLISFAAFAGPEDCCPTPCATTTEVNMMTVDPSGESSCVAACCDSEPPAPMSIVAAETTSMSDIEETDQTCVATCCSTNDDGATLIAETTPTIASVEPDTTCVAACCATEETTSSSAEAAGPTLATMSEEAACGAECCPDTDPSLVTADSGSFMSLFWLLMTPVGGVILVTAHLTNHRLDCRCKAACCPHSRDDQSAE